MKRKVSIPAPMVQRFFRLCLLCALLLGCGAALELKPTSHTLREPSNVVMLFRVDGPDGPAQHLTEDSFSVSENGVPVPSGPDLRVVRPYLRETLRLLVLLDFGGHPGTEARAAMISAARRVIARLSVHAQIAVYVFDGSPHAEPVVIARADDETVRDKLDRLMDRPSRDTSTDLHGALLASIKTLQLESSPPRPHTGMLLLISRSADRAARTSKEAVEDKLDARDMELMRFVIAYGEHADAEGYEWLTDEANIWTAADEVALQTEARKAAARLDAIARSYYLVSLCSGVRAGATEVEIVARRQPPEAAGGEAQTGSHVWRFPADGFGPNCTPWFR